MSDRNGVSLFAKVLDWVGPSEDGKGALLPDRLQLNEAEHIVALGDSITQQGGYLRAMDAVFDQQYPELRLPTIENAGIGGQKAEDLVPRLFQDVIAKRPRIAMVNVGINDVWHRLDAPPDEDVLRRYQENLGQIVGRLHAAEIRVLLLTPTVIEEKLDSEGNRRLTAYVAAGKEIAGRQGCECVDLHGLFLRAIANQSRLDPEAEHRTARVLTSDGVHMNPSGDVLMAVGVLRSLGVSDAKMKATDLRGMIERT